MNKIDKVEYIIFAENNVVEEYKQVFLLFLLLQ